MQKLLLSISLLLCFSLVHASEKADHSIFDKLLKKHVSASGKVNYKGFIEDIKEFDEYLREVREHAPMKDWSRSEKKAFYINAYNAYTIKFIITKYPVKSVKDVKFSGKDIWSFKMVQIGPTKYTLSQVEDNILRRMNDPRIHFAINCGATSCPKMLNAAYLPETLNGQLTRSTKNFVRNTAHNTLGPKKVKISKIFEWYAEDFKKDGNSIIKFLNEYGQVTIKEDAKIEYKEYNWELNE